jgi:peptidoglycan/LPS O-acetylase OafA/YrhL
MVATVAVNGSPTIDPMCLATKMLSLPALTPSFHHDGCSSAGNGPLLTVTVEIWLYAIYGAVFALLANRKRDQAILVISGASFLLSVAVAALSTRYAVLYNWWQNSSVLGFLPYWWLGAALVIPGVRQWAKRRFILISVCWIGLTIVIPLGGEIGSAIAELRKVVFSLGIGAIIAWLESAKLAESNPLSFIGRAGYSLYAFHAPLLLPLVLAGVWWPLTLAAIIAFGVIAYFIVERPMIALGKRLAQNRKPDLRAA